ncbi:MAG: hypothetical protein C0501_21880 [Isosphaera sp.]|nr:hypothetical protein [Isosphaera sp.]
MSDAPRRRRSLTHVGGGVRTAGDAADGDRLARALAVAPATDAPDDPARAHVHGFHTYPARMHPTTAARLVRAFAPSGGRVLDPFCGSGTVLVEAQLAGLAARGTDLNPLAVLLSRCKTRPRTAAELGRLVERATECAETADARRKAKAGATRRFPDEDVRLFEPHVLLELDSLRAAVAAVPDATARADLWLVLSSLLVKLSRQAADTSDRAAPRRTAAGFAARLFARKAEELAGRLAAFARLLPSPPPPAAADEDDATAPATVRPGMADAIVTSPPYAATYDYAAHHALRMRWLGLNASKLTRGELGSRAAYRRVKPGAARETWGRELAGFFQSAARLLPPGGPLVLVMADSAVGGAAVRADEVVAEVGRACGFVPAACASQDRPHFHGPGRDAFRDRPRAEHAILLRRA